MRFLIAVTRGRFLAALLVFLVTACGNPATAVATGAPDEAYLAKAMVAIQRAEQYRARPYPDRGAWAVGYGRNLNARGISRSEALFLLHNDVNDVVWELDQYLPWWRGLNGPRRAALVEMGYNLGVGGLLGFERMLAAAEAGDWARTETEALDSRWASQVGSRANRLARQLRSGQWQP